MSEYLAHHGILNQKWGIRRYQNKDGSLTPAGRERYNKLKKELDSLEGKSTNPRKKKVSEMSDEELDTALNRIRKELDYAIAYKQLYPEKITMGKAIMNKLKTEAIPNAVSTFTQNMVGKVLGKVGGEIFKDFTNDVKKDAVKSPKKEENQPKTEKPKKDNTPKVKAEYAGNVFEDYFNSRNTSSVSYDSVVNSDSTKQGSEWVSYYIPNRNVDFSRLLDNPDRFKHMDNSNYLVHHGIKGQKWGIRRYQNEDGSLTEAGRAKLGRYQKRALKQAERRYKRERKNALDEQKKNNETVAKDVLEDIKARKSKEIEAIKNMKLSDIKEERKAAAGVIATNLGVNLAIVGASVGAGVASVAYTGWLPLAAPVAAVGGLLGMTLTPAVASQAKIDKRLKRAGYE